MSAGEDVDYDLLLRKCKIFAYAHHVILRPAPAKFITCFLDKDFQKVCDAFQATPFGHYAKAALVSVVFLFLPMIYGHTVMDYPCNAVEKMIGDSEAGLAAKIVQTPVQECKAQDYIRSLWSLLLAPGAYFLGYLIFQLSVTWRACGKFSPVLYAMQVDHVRPSLKKLWCQPSPGPGSFGQPMAVYYAMLLQMLMVAGLLRSIVAVVVALALGRFFLVLCNRVFATDDIFTDMVECELAAVSPALLRIFQGGVRNSAWVSLGELEQLWNNDGLRDAVQSDMFPQMFWMTFPNLDADKKPFSDVRIFCTQVYIGEHNLTVDVADESIRRGKDLVWRREDGEESLLSGEE